MMKLHGKTYNHCILKILLDDKIMDMLKTLTQIYDQPDNRHTVVGLIIDKFNQTQAWIKADKELKDKKLLTEKQTGGEDEKSN